MTIRARVVAIMEHRMTRNEKLARWAGWKPYRRGVWIGPGGTRTSDGIPDYEHSLDACMELVEKMNALGYQIILGQHWDLSQWECEILHRARDGWAESAMTAPQAICAAVEQIIDG